MWNLQTKLILILLQVVSVFTTGKDKNVATSSNVQSTNGILPLVLIVSNADNIIRPTTIKKISTTENGEILGDTIFSNSIKPNAKQIYACSMGTMKNAYSNYNVQPDDQKCTYWTSFESTEPLTCRFEPEPFVEKVNLPCGPEKRGEMYRFVYKVCLTDGPISNSNVLERTIMLNPINQRNSFEIYQFCYNEVDKEVIYTTYKLNSADLLRDENLSNERRKQFPMMSDGYGYFGTHYQEIDQAYLELEASYIALHADYEKYSSTLKYQIQKLIPEDYAEFALWKKPFFHYLNGRLMERTQAELWSYIDMSILIDAKLHDRSYSTRTGVLTLDENRGKKEAILGKMFLPDIWLKFIDYEYLLSPRGEIAYKGIAIIMNTNPGNPAADAYLNNICKKNVCEKYLSGIFSEQLKNTVRCCSVTHEILKFFDSTIIHRDLLEISLLVDENDDTADELSDVSANKEGQPSPSKKQKGRE